MSRVFNIGDKVCYTVSKSSVSSSSDSNYDAYETGTVISIQQDSKIDVEWKYPWAPKTWVERHSPNDIMTVAEAEETWNKFQEELNELELRLKNKTEAAVNALKEVAQEASDSGFTLRQLNTIARKVEEVIDSAGWNTSSLNC